jgi:hypothetical protein
MSQLGGSLFKVIWAQEHLDDLKLETRKYVGSHPYHFPTDEDGEDVIVSRPELSASPEFGIARYVGDCMNNCMAALDYIVWELARKYAGRPLAHPPAGTDTPSFPLYADPVVYAKNPGRFKHYNFPAAALHKIESVQPYNAGYECLAQLYFLVNEDKHRLPLIVQGELKSGDIELRYRGVEFRATSSATDVSFNTRDPRLAPYRASDMYVDGQVTPFVALAYASMKGEPVETTAERIVSCVRGVVDDFIALNIV